MLGVLKRNFDLTLSYVCIFGIYTQGLFEHGFYSYLLEMESLKFFEDHS